MACEQETQFVSNHDLYDLLEVGRDATPEDIKAHYTELVLIHHPDKGGDIKKFKAIQLAYKILSNEKNREIYTKSLSSTFTELADEYRDAQNGQHRALSYGVSEEDFNFGTEQEREIKKNKFMEKFNENRNKSDQELIDHMSADCQRKMDEYRAIKDLKYEDLLKDEQVQQKPIDELNSKSFNVNFFNQMFEKSRKAPSNDLTPYEDLSVNTRTDLAPVNEDSLFKTSADTTANFDFMTHQISHVDTSCDDKIDNTKTRDLPGEDVFELMKKRAMERNLFDEEELIRKTHAPPFKDTHPLSYQSMGLNFS